MDELLDTLNDLPAFLIFVGLWVIAIAWICRRIVLERKLNALLNGTRVRRWGIFREVDLQSLPNSARGQSYTKIHRRVTKTAKRLIYAILFLVLAARLVIEFL